MDSRISKNFSRKFVTNLTDRSNYENFKELKNLLNMWNMEKYYEYSRETGLTEIHFSVNEISESSMFKILDLISELKYQKLILSIAGKVVSKKTHTTQKILNTEINENSYKNNDDSREFKDIDAMSDFISKFIELHLKFEVGFVKTTIFENPPGISFQVFRKKKYLPLETEDLDLVLGAYTQNPIQNNEHILLESIYVSQSTLNWLISKCRFEMAENYRSLPNSYLIPYLLKQHNNYYEYTQILGIHCLRKPERDEEYPDFENFIKYLDINYFSMRYEYIVYPFDPRVPLEDEQYVPRDRIILLEIAKRFDVEVVSWNPLVLKTEINIEWWKSALEDILNGKIPLYSTVIPRALEYLESNNLEQKRSEILYLSVFAYSQLSSEFPILANYLSDVYVNSGMVVSLRVSSKKEISRFLEIYSGIQKFPLTSIPFSNLGKSLNFRIRMSIEFPNLKILIYDSSVSTKNKNLYWCVFESQNTREKTEKLTQILTKVQSQKKIRIDTNSFYLSNSDTLYTSSTFWTQILGSEDSISENEYFFSKDTENIFIEKNVNGIQKLSESWKGYYTFDIQYNNSRKTLKGFLKWPERPNLSSVLMSKDKKLSELNLGVPIVQQFREFGTVDEYDKDELQKGGRDSMVYKVRSGNAFGGFVISDPEKIDFSNGNKNSEKNLKFIIEVAISDFDLYQIQPDIRKSDLGHLFWMDDFSINYKSNKSFFKFLKQSFVYNELNKNINSEFTNNEISEGNTDKVLNLKIFEQAIFKIWKSGFYLSDWAFSIYLETFKISSSLFRYPNSMIRLLSGYDLNTFESSKYSMILALNTLKSDNLK